MHVFTSDETSNILCLFSFDYAHANGWLGFVLGVLLLDKFSFMFIEVI